VISRRHAVAAVVAGGLLLGACGDDDGGSGESGLADSNEAGTVILKGNEFRPEKISVKVGDTVTWKWQDSNVQHDVNGGDLFKSEIMKEGTFTHTFDEAGTFDYKCTVHPAMTGTVEVTGS
jgi:plastocyanin